MALAANTSLSPFSLWLILIFAINLSALSFGLVFKEWNYTILSVIFDLAFLLANGNYNSLIYLDMGCKVILVNKMWLIKKHLGQKISAISILIKVRNINVSKYKLEKFVLITLYILSFNCNETKVYICIKCKLHLI